MPAITPLSIFIVAVFMVSLLSAPLLGAGWFWDFGNALGFAAMAGILYLTVATGPGINVRAHRRLGYVVLGASAAHALWFLVGDTVVIEYLKPGAPHYMWAGVAGLIAVTALTIIALPRVRSRLHNRYAGFRWWHRVIAILAIAGSAWHIVGSQYYLGRWYALLVFVAMVFAVALAHRRLSAFVRIEPGATKEFVFAGTIVMVVVVGLRNLFP